MLTSHPEHTRRSFLRHLSLFFLPVAAGLAMLFALFHHLDYSQELAHLQLRDQYAVNLGRQEITRDLESAVTDLLVLAHSDALRRLAGNDGRAQRQAVVDQFRRFAVAKGIYDQVRYLDAAGREVVRINARSGVTVVPATQLQDKSDRYYFQASRSLAPGAVYVSRFDLNVENHQVELPPRPMIRFITRVQDLQGRPRGVVVLNYLGSRMIAHIRTAMAGTAGKPMLLDHQGFWLYGPERAREWGRDLGHGRNFAKEHPRAWAEMDTLGTGQLQLPDGRYVFTTVQPLSLVVAEVGQRLPVQIAQHATSPSFWRLVTALDRDMLWTLRWQRARGPVAAFSLLAVLWLGVSAYLARNRAVRAAARELVARLSSVVEQTNDMVFITDPRGLIEYVNPSFERVTGYTSADVVGRPPSVLRSGAHDRSYYERLWSTILRGDVFQDVLTNRTKSGTRYYEQKTITPLKDEHGHIAHFVSTGKDITEQMVAQERLYHLAYHNPLTDLPNRRLFRDRVERATAHARRGGRLTALLFLDLDRFKNVNDSLGHDAGDQLLVQVAARLTGAVRDDDTVAHLGGDEFAILLEDVADAAQVEAVVGKLHREFERPFHIDNREVFTSISVGIALYPVDDVDVDKLIKNADTAMYHAKEQGRNRFEFYSRDMSERVSRRLSLEAELRRALEREEFTVHYQPIVDFSIEQIVGLEALLRWQHPERGLIPPREFISVMEETGLIVPLTRWTLQQACVHGRRLRAQAGRELYMAVNFSAPCFHGQGVAQPVTEALTTGCIEPRQLVVDITESILMDHRGSVQQALRQLDTLGVRIAIDDFGTGYSSLSYLKRFPVHMLKIDRQFLRSLPDNRDDAALASAIIAMAGNLGIEVVAEGVETERQLEFLLARGCQHGQGALFSTPLSPEALEEHLRARQAFPWG
jgi:diguanylate cyclase (GGDEF)-like protein/PAS domain S-box-containing protein